MKALKITFYAICAMFCLWMLVSFLEVNAQHELSSNWNFFVVLLRMWGM